MVDVGSGLECLDVGSLKAEQQDKLLQFKINARIANEKYLRSHKELELLLSGFLRQVERKASTGKTITARVETPDITAIREVLMQRPENIREFAAGYFTNPELPKKIRQQMMEKLNEAV